VDKDKLRLLTKLHEKSWSETKRKRAGKLLEDLSVGGSAYQEVDLPAATLPNAKSAYVLYMGKY